MQNIDCEIEKLNELNDPFKPILKKTVDLVNYRVFNIFTVIAFLIYGITTLIFFYYVVKTFDITLLLVYGPLQFMLFSGIAGIMTYWYSINNLKEMKKTILGFCWALNSFNQKTTNSILFESNCINIFHSFNGIVMMIVALYHLPFVTSEKHIFFAIDFFTRELPTTISSILNFIYYITSFIICYMMIINIYTLIYSCHHCKFQKQLLNVFVKKLSIVDEYTNLEEYDLVRNVKYQRIISNRLKTCIKHHSLIASLEKKMNDIVYIPLLVLCGFAILIIISIAFSIMANPSNINYFRIGLVFFAAIISVLPFLYSGQSLINESFKLYENTKKCDWTGWNYKNKQTLIIFLINLQQMPVVGVPGILVCEYNFTINIAQVIGSFWSFLLQVVPN